MYSYRWGLYSPLQVVVVHLSHSMSFTISVLRSQTSAPPVRKNQRLENMAAIHFFDKSSKARPRTHLFEHARKAKPQRSRREEHVEVRAHHQVGTQPPELGELKMRRRRTEDLGGQSHKKAGLDSKGNADGGESGTAVKR